ncbi:MAG: hypothetical protein GIW95_12175 [Candidatus Eremiobacteraeota bacterium]|nr:hypothetical protein [Candidatus Eremiobacteraeota bacterium]
MFEHVDVAALEAEIEEFAREQARAVEERTEVDRWIERGQQQVASARERLPEAEANARERRRYRPEVNAQRSELEHELSDLIDNETGARMRREQAEQRALGFRAAETFAGAARIDAEKLGDRERVQRERMVEERARHEADLLEARARHDRADEERLSAERIELEERVNASRATEIAAAKDREEAEAVLNDLRRDVALAQDELDRAQYEATRLDLEIVRLADQQRAAEERLRHGRREALGQLERRIAELHASELDASKRRAEAETLLRRLRDDVHRETPERAAARPEASPNGVAHAAADRPIAERLIFSELEATPSEIAEPEAALPPAAAQAAERSSQRPAGRVAAPNEKKGDLGIAKLIFGLLGGKRR